MQPEFFQRYLDAQQSVYGTALHEIRSGRKRTHWMWYIFPQLKGLSYLIIVLSNLIK
ncbi:DUF1810 family protein [Mucilaginibacter gynuensis]|uniref:DUF1810 family protein n=1 Tax=Mucilaginibacter gynuensis TaxID=1302236 RepID=UPI003CD08B1D